MSDFLTNKKHNECIVNWLYKLAKADGNYTVDEEQLIKGFQTSLDVELSDNTDIIEELTEEEILFTLRELYRLAICDGDFSVEEKSIVDDFCQKYSVKSEVIEITKNWFEELKKAEENYQNKINEYYSL